MSYEYNVPYVDFITAFGKNDDADKFFDELEKPAVNERPDSQEKCTEENTCRLVLQEISESIQNIEISQNLAKQGQKSLQSCKSRDKQRTENNASVKQSTQNNTEISQNIAKPLSTVKPKKQFQTIEEINGKMCIKNNEVKHTGVPRRIPSRQTKTIMLCSFEERQKLQIERKEQLLKKVLQEEQEKRVFHANPVPKYLKINKQKKIQMKTHCSSLMDNTKNSFQDHQANLITKKKYLPKKTNPVVVKLKNVMLHSEKRAQERKKFEEKLKLHHQEMEMKATARKEMQLQLEKKEIAELRKKLVHKAKPVPVYSTAFKPANSTLQKSITMFARSKE